MLESRFLRKSLSTTPVALFLILLCLSTTPISSVAMQQSSCAALTFSPMNVSVSQVGDIVTLQVPLNAGNVFFDTVSLGIVFDPALLQVVDAQGNPTSKIELGDLPGAAVVNIVSNIQGNIDYGHIIIGGQLGGTFTVAIVRFKIIASLPSGGTEVAFVNQGRTGVFDAGANQLCELPGPARISMHSTPDTATPTNVPTLTQTATPTEEQDQWRALLPLVLASSNPADTGICGQYIRIQQSLDKWPAFLPHGSNEPWVIDPSIFGIFKEGGYARIFGPSFGTDLGPTGEYLNARYLVGYSNVISVSSCEHNTNVPTNTPVPTITNTPVPPTATLTPIPPTPTFTSTPTPVPPTPTNTSIATPVPPTPTNTSIATPGQTPMAPSNPRATVIDSTRIRLDWNDNANNEAGFAIYDGNVQGASLGANTTSYTVTGLAPGSYHCYHLYAFNVYGNSNWTDWACASTPQLTATPTNTPISTATNTSTATPTNTPVPTITNTPAPPTPTFTLVPPTPTFTSTPTLVPPTPTNTAIPTSTLIPTATRTPVPTNTPTNTPTYTPIPCPRKAEGDADCNGHIDLVDYEIWRKEYFHELNTKTADFNGDGVVDMIDYNIWLAHYPS
jgi:hypothetical protein